MVKERISKTLPAILNCVIVYGRLILFDVEVSTR